MYNSLWRTNRDLLTSSAWISLFNFDSNFLHFYRALHFLAVCVRDLQFCKRKRKHYSSVGNGYKEAGCKVNQRLSSQTKVKICTLRAIFGRLVNLCKKWWFFFSTKCNFISGSYCGTRTQCERSYRATQSNCSQSRNKR